MIYTVYLHLYYGYKPSLLLCTLDRDAAQDNPDLSQDGDILRMSQDNRI